MSYIDCLHPDCVHATSVHSVLQVMKAEQKQNLCALADRCQEKRKETKVMLAQLIQHAMRDF